MKLLETEFSMVKPHIGTTTQDPSTNFTGKAVATVDGT